MIIGAVREFTTVTPTRSVDDANNVRTPITPVDIVVYLEPPQPVMGERGKRWIQSGLIRVRPGSDLQDGDEIPLPEGTFGVIGRAEPARAHPITGNTFGWVRYHIRKGG